MTKQIFSVLIINLMTTVFAAEVQIVQLNKEFSQKEITIKKGDAISFKNAETNVTHNVFSLGPANGFELKTQAPGESSTAKFAEVGVTEVECAIHPNMKLKVNVVE